MACAPIRGTPTRLGARCPARRGELPHERNTAAVLRGVKRGQLLPFFARCAVAATNFARALDLRPFRIPRSRQDDKRRSGAPMRRQRGQDALVRNSVSVRCAANVGANRTQQQRRLPFAKVNSPTGSCWRRDLLAPASQLAAYSCRFPCSQVPLWHEPWPGHE